MLATLRFSKAEIDLIDKEKSPCWVPKKLMKLAEDVKVQKSAHTFSS